MPRIAAPRIRFPLAIRDGLSWNPGRALPLWLGERASKCRALPPPRRHWPATVRRCHRCRHRRRSLPRAWRTCLRQPREVSLRAALRREKPVFFPERSGGPRRLRLHRRLVSEEMPSGRGVSKVIFVEHAWKGSLTVGGRTSAVSPWPAGSGAARQCGCPQVLSLH